MKKYLIFSLMLMLFACGEDKTKEVEETQEAAVQEEVQATAEENDADYLKWKEIIGEPEKFMTEYNKLDDVQKYYFCAAFSVGAMSVAKPETASAMVNYFIGLGKVKYDRGIDDDTYKAFDFGKNVFRFEEVIDKILDDQICERIMSDAADFANDKKLSVETLNDAGKPEVEKIVKYLKK